MNNYIFLPSFSVLPNKVTSYNSVFIKNPETKIIKSIHEFKKKRKSLNNSLEVKPTLEKKAHDFTISKNAYQNLKKKINWLYFLSKSKSVKTSTGKEIFNYKISFITLTLPSKQKHPTNYITEKILNNFLTEIRLKFKMNNYVWRLEFQKNGNVHYHLVTDSFIDYEAIRTIWNKKLYSEGYVQEYQKKFSKLSLTDYNQLVNENGKKDFKNVAQSYAKAKACNWSQPPSVDVKSVISNKAIANYISKYFSKSQEGYPIKNEHDNEENSSFLRLWFCSRSVSKLDKISGFCEAVDYDIFAIVSYAEKVKKIIHKYAISYYFDIATMTGNARKWMEKLLRDYSRKQNYLPAT